MPHSIYIDFYYIKTSQCLSPLGSLDKQKAPKIAKTKQNKQTPVFFL